MTTYESIFTAAFQLPVADRLRLIDELAATVPDDALPYDALADNEVFPLSAEWMEEIKRRSDEIDSGQAESIPWEEVRKKMFKKVGLDGAD